MTANDNGGVRSTRPASVAGDVDLRVQSNVSIGDSCVDASVNDRVDTPFIVAAKPTSATGDGFFREFEIGSEVSGEV